MITSVPDLCILFTFDDCLFRTGRGSTSGFLWLWLTVLVFTDISPLHFFKIVLKVIEKQ